jgi:hypothetical protein
MQKSPTINVKETYYTCTRDLLYTQKRLAVHEKRPAVYTQKRHTGNVKNTYYTCKRVLLYMYKRPTIYAKETCCIYAKEAY